MAEPESLLGRVLVFAPIGRDGPATAQVLRRADIDAYVCSDYAELVRELGHGAGTALVAEEGLFGADLKKLVVSLAAQGPWSDPPFIVLTSNHEYANVVRWRQQMVTTLGNVALLERPVQPITLVSVVRAAQRARERQYQVKALLQARDSAAMELEFQVAQRTRELEAANAQLRVEMTERARAEESLRHAQKIEAMGQLTGGVAHDFNNLLMVITGGLDMLELQKDPARRRRLMEGMRQAASRGSRLTRQLLTFSRKHALRSETISLSHHLQGMREMLERSLRGDVQVELQLPPDLWPVEVDPDELELVLLNLAVNARDAMPNGGTIVIRGCNVAACGPHEHERVALSIIDTGIGMSEEVKDRVFEPFFTTKDVGKGSGLGLAQVYGFAQQSGGSVRVDSQPGQGTAITLVLPRSGKVLDAPQPATQGPAHPHVEAVGCVLLVEDDGEVATLVIEMLGQLGYQTVHASTAEAALGALANNRRIDLVFSDIMMPGGIDGVELARRVRQRRAGMPVLLTSGYAESRQEAATAIGLPVLAKPYTLRELEAAIAQAQARAPAAPAEASVHA